MKQYIFLIFLMLSISTVDLSAQNDIDYVLSKVEELNQDLAARRELTSAQKLEAQTGKYLSNPEVEFEHLWSHNRPSETAGELNVNQAFDFPSAYSNRNKIAKLKQSMYDNEGAAFRQQLLLDAKLLCLEIIYLRKQQLIIDNKVTNAERISQSYKDKMDAGDANILEYNKTQVELINAQTQSRLNRVALNSKLEMLNNLTGGIPVEFSATDYDWTFVLPSFESLETMYFENNPELANIQNEFDVNSKNVALSKSLSLPKFELGYRHDFGGGVNSNGLRAGMSIPLFENKNTVKAAKAQALYSQKKLQSTKLNKTIELKQLYDQAITLLSSLNMMRNVVNKTNENITLLEKALDAGQIPVTDYFTEYATIYESQLSMLAIEKQYQDVIAQICRFEL